MAKMHRRLNIQWTNVETRVVMKPVVQLERTGCGIASVAALAGVSYREAQRVANRIGIFSDDPKLWSEPHHVRRLLKEYGIGAASTRVPFTSWETLPDRALLAVKWHNEGDRALGIVWCFGKDQTDLSCSIRSAHFADMHGPTLAVSSRKWFSPVSSI